MSLVLVRSCLCSQDLLVVIVLVSLLLLLLVVYVVVLFQHVVVLVAFAFETNKAFIAVDHYDFVAHHSMWIIFLKGYCVLVRVEIIHKSKFLPGTVEKNSSTMASGRNRTYACAMPVHCSDH